MLHHLTLLIIISFALGYQIRPLVDEFTSTVADLSRRKRLNAVELDKRLAEMEEAIFALTASVKK